MLFLSPLFERAKPDLKPGEYIVPHREREKVRHLNPKTNRMKNFKRVKWIKTNIPPEERTLRNIPKYSDGKPKVTTTQWLEIKGKKRNPDSQVNTYGWAANGKCYGWSHRAIHGFSVGEEITNKVCGFEDLKKPFKIKNKEQCEEIAQKFAEAVG